MPVCSLAIAAGVVGLVVVAKKLAFRARFGGPMAFAGAGCRGEAEGEGHGHRRGGWGGFRRGPGRSFWLRALFTRLDTTPGQEREIRGAIEEFQSAAWKAKDGVKDAKGDIARAIGGELFDDSAVADASARVEATTTQVRDAFTASLKRVHAALDDKQRERLAELLSKERPFGSWRNPYRG